MGVDAGTVDFRDHRRSSRRVSCVVMVWDGCSSVGLANKVVGLGFFFLSSLPPLVLFQKICAGLSRARRSECAIGWDDEQRSSQERVVVVAGA